MTSTLQSRAAKALDVTHGKARNGKHSEQARAIVAGWLDGLAIKRSTARAMVAYLEMIDRTTVAGFPPLYSF